MTKKTILILCLAMFAAGSSVRSFSQERQTVDKIVANVGNAAILYSDVVEAEADMIMQARAYGQALPMNTFYVALEQLMETKLGYTQALIDSVQVDLSGVGGRVEQVVAGMVEQAGSVRALEQSSNMPIYDLKSMLTKRVEEQQYFQAMRGDVVGGITITPGEVEAYYESLPKDSVPIVPDQYMYAQITKYPPSMTEAKQRLRERMLQMRADLIAGTSRFEVLARLYSKDDESANRGGELPPMGRDEMEEVFRATVAKLRPGQFSEIVETDNGFHIIELLETMGDRYRIRHIVMTPEYTAEEIEAAVHTLDSLATRIRQDSITFERAALMNSDDKNTRMNGGLVTDMEQLAYQQGGYAQAGMVSFRFRREQFTGNVYADYQKLVDMTPGDISDAYRTRDFRGNPEAKVIKLLEFYPTHEANLSDDYLELEAMALGKKREDAYAKWLARTIQATYIRVDPAYREGLDQKWVK